MGTCVKCGSARVKTLYRDGLIRTICKEKSCRYVAEDRDGFGRQKIRKSEAEEVAERVEG